MSIEQEARAAVTDPSTGRLTALSATRATNPGILEALGYAGDGLDRVEHALTDRLPAAIARLVDKLGPLTRQTPPSVDDRGAPRTSGPASDESSVAAQQVATLGNRALNAHDRIEQLAAQLDELTARVDLT